MSLLARSIYLVAVHSDGRFGIPSCPPVHIDYVLAGPSLMSQRIGLALIVRANMVTAYPAVKKGISVGGQDHHIIHTVKTSPLRQIHILEAVRNIGRLGKVLEFLVIIRQHRLAVVNRRAKKYPGVAHVLTLQKLEQRAGIRCPRYPRPPRLVPWKP